MTAGTVPATGRHAGLDEPGAGPPPGRQRWRRWLIVVAALALLAGGALVAVGHVLGSGGRTGGSDDNAAATSLATVERRSLSQRVQVNGVLGYAGSYTVPGGASGRVTWLPAAGQVIDQGQVLYRANDAPVVLLFGSTPAYRDLTEGAAGADVAQLNHDLVALA